jgi:hypothetical protein
MLAAMRSSPARMAVLVLGVVAIMLVAPLVGARPAAAASCSANSCSHLDPQTNGCSADAYDLEAFNPEGAYTVELRYSPTCRAAWARITDAATGYPQWKYLKLQVWDAHTGGHLLWTETRYVEQTVSGLDYWTAMGSFNYWVQACVKNASDYGHCSVRH